MSETNNKKWSKDKLDNIYNLLQEGLTYQQLSSMYNSSEASIRVALNTNGYDSKLKTKKTINNLPKKSYDEYPILDEDLDD